MMAYRWYGLTKFGEDVMPRFRRHTTHIRDPDGNTILTRTSARFGDAYLLHPGPHYDELAAGLQKHGYKRRDEGFVVELWEKRDWLV